MKKSNWQRAKELILSSITAADSYRRADIIRLLRKNRVQDTDGNWVDQLLRALVDGGKLKRTGKRGEMRYAGAGRRKAIDLRSTLGPKKAAATKRAKLGTISEMALAAAKHERLIAKHFSHAKRPLSTAPRAWLILEVDGKRIFELDLAKVSL